MKQYFIKILFLIVSLSATFHVYSQCDIINTTFISGEKLEYSVYYNLGVIWVEAGKVIFEVQSTDYNNIDVYHFIGKGVSLEKYDWIFKVRDRYDSYSEKTTLKPLKFVRNTYEGGYAVNNTYIFDYYNKLVFTNSSNSKKETETDTLRIDNCIHDMLSYMYFARNFDFSDYEINQKISFTAIVDNEIVELYGRYLGKEAAETKDGRLYDCLKFSAFLMSGSIFGGGEDLFVWITNDNNKIPIKVETKILVGSVKVFFEKGINLRHDLKSRLK